MNTHVRVHTHTHMACDKTLAQWQETTLKKIHLGWFDLHVHVPFWGEYRSQNITHTLQMSKLRAIYETDDRISSKVIDVGHGTWLTCIMWPHILVGLSTNQLCFGTGSLLWEKSLWGRRQSCSHLFVPRYRCISTYTKQWQQIEATSNWMTQKHARWFCYCQKQCNHSTTTNGSDATDLEKSMP